MSCSTKMKTPTRTGFGWSAGDTTTDKAVLITEAFEIAAFASLRVQVELRGNSGVQCKRCYALSDDGITWDSAVTFDDASYMTGNGFNYPSVYSTPDSGKRYFRLGITCKNTAGSDIEQVRATLTINFQPR